MMKTTARDANTGGYTAFTRLGLCLAFCLLGGCSLLVPLQTGGVQEMPLSPVEYYAWAQTASRTELEKELTGLEVVRLGDDPVVIAVRRSIILSTSVVADIETEAEARELIEDVGGLQPYDSFGQAYHKFATVLDSLLQRSKELEEARSATQRVRREIDALKTRNQELEEQIEEITGIEQQIIEREQRDVRE